MKMDLQVLADTLRESNCDWLIDEIAKKDVATAQMLDVLIMEDGSWEPPTLK